MKNIRCELDNEDYVKVKFGKDFATLIIGVSDKNCEFETGSAGIDAGIYLGSEKIRKLRKQLKKALLQIEGVKEEWKAGDKVYLIHGDGEGPDYSTSPSTHGIDLRLPVTLKNLGGGKRWMVSYTDTDGKNVSVGYASEHSFGKRSY